VSPKIRIGIGIGCKDRGRHVILVTAIHTLATSVFRSLLGLLDSDFRNLPKTYRQGE